MVIITKVIEINEAQVVIQVCIDEFLKKNKVCVLGAATIDETNRYVELAQARAIALARRILAEGLDAVDPAEYLSPAASPALATPPAHVPLPTAVPSSATPTKTAEPPIIQPTAVSPIDSQVEETLPDPTELPDVPW